jgi:Flp pilus assembly pilin Flp
VSHGAAPGIFCTRRILEEDAMQLAVALLVSLQRHDEGQDLLEYALLMSLIAVVAITAVTSVGNAIVAVFWSAIAAASV